MSKKAPPVPPENQSAKGPGDTKKTPQGSSTHISDQHFDPDKQGQSANTKVNIINQGHQQDR